MYKLYIFILIYSSLTLAACSVTKHIPKVYKINVQQGNVVDQEMIEKLKPGMTKQQVKFVLGTPTIIDSFESNRWYYIYSYKPGRGDREQHTIAVWFKNELLSYITGNVKINPELADKGLQIEQVESVTVPPRQEPKGFLSKAKHLLHMGKDSTQSPKDKSTTGSHGKYD
ncbi:outer membrane protein assembly factor BamE [Candidatus Nitrosacidococcus sp. I8]|uniref:outer membrane protein assembly factor BamE n=1 Tax=Candidatus Nitrosacidococcus sp. I8 TaxID=2942908 RepID=UPI002226B5BA|nr:outer membrane protein assembly factor BamE [Candidatus Nitrosacidococcus sp. I8]CAH9018938.1 Outer membrane protein assembly factor BamE [Candidatus Nitrosacidococcus sp. I8]